MQQPERSKNMTSSPSIFVTWGQLCLPWNGKWRFLGGRYDHKDFTQISFRKFDRVRSWEATVHANQLIGSWPSCIRIGTKKNTKMHQANHWLIYGVSFPLSFYGFKNYPSSVTFFFGFLIKPTRISWYLDFSSWTLLISSRFRQLFPPKGGGSMTSSFQKEACCQTAKASKPCVVGNPCPPVLLGKIWKLEQVKPYPFAALDSAIYELKKHSKNLTDLAYFLALGFVFGGWCSKIRDQQNITQLFNFQLLQTPWILEFWNTTAKVTMAKTMSQRLKRPKAWRDFSTRKGEMVFLGFFLEVKNISTFRIPFTLLKTEATRRKKLVMLVLYCFF